MEDRGARAASGPRSAGRTDQEGRRRRLGEVAGRGSARWEPIVTLTSAIFASPSGSFLPFLIVSKFPVVRQGFAGVALDYLSGVFSGWVRSAGCRTGRPG